MGFSKKACLLLTFFAYLLYYFSVLVCALDTITPSLLIQEPEKVSSNNNMFTLGFFRPQNSTNRYVGIWLMSKSSVVWVANRNNPLTDTSGILTISENGNLVVLNGQKQVVWSTNVSIASNSSAQLLDTGNLVLVDRTTGVSMWQSFQHPSDTLLQDMRLSTIQKTGEKVQLTSWKSTADPSYGVFAGSIEPRNVIEVFIWKENHPYWRSGPWNGTHFLGVPESSSTFLNGFQIKEEKGSFEIYFHYTDKSLLLTLRLDPQGKIQKQRWNPQTNIWELEWITGVTECDFYGTCGPFGICNSLSSPICSCLRGFEPKNKEEWESQNWTSGCIRREALQCKKENNGSQVNKTDGFIKLERIKPPDHAEALPFNFEGTVDCRTSCLKNCSCVAYAFASGLGCMLWNADLVDLERLLEGGGVDLYIRLAYSELGRARSITAPIVISVLMGTILITASGYFSWKKITKRKGEMEMHIDEKRRITNLKHIKIQELSLFDHRRLATATNNFDLKNKLGQGGFGPVYKGKLEDGQEIAVKRLSRSSGQGMEEFINEVELISKLQHRNLVRLLGYCIEREEEILVYEYMPNKSLDAYIFDPLRRKSLDWGKRFSIIEGIARGLLYLHKDSRLKIIHRDLKASNILLDEKMNPKISDFGMAKLFGGSEDQANTGRIVGTYGYISPEYATEGLYSEKSDVFSFGVLLLEIISGRKNISFYEDAETFTLLGYAWKLWIDDNITPLIDPQIYDPDFQKDILRCIHIGLLCVQELAKDRPSMVSIMLMLQSEIMDIPPPSQPAFILRQKMPHSIKQTPKNDDLYSTNKMQQRGGGMGEKRNRGAGPGGNSTGICGGEKTKHGEGYQNLIYVKRTSRKARGAPPLPPSPPATSSPSLSPSFTSLSVAVSQTSVAFKNAFLFVITYFSCSCWDSSLYIIPQIATAEFSSRLNPLFFGMFTLGFFSPKNSTNRYVGIWFLSESNVVWVANRNNPLRDSSGILTISENNGNLVVLDGQKQILWSTNVSSIASNSSAQLLDSGNLVLVDGITGSTVWQSFEHPCDTLLQDMKLSTNQHTGEKVRLTSWKSASDPSSGEFSCGLEPRNVTEIFVWKENHPYFRSGPWDGVNFLGIPRTISSNSQTGFQLKGEQGSFNLSFYSDKSLWSFTLNSQGKVEQRLWNSQTNAWDLRRIMYSSDCDVYGKCGPFGICDLQNSPICSCLRGFEPKNKEEWARQNWTNGLSEYSSLIFDTGKGSRKMTTPIIISVLIGTILITVAGYFLWKKCSKQRGEMQMQTKEKRQIMSLKQVHIPELLLFDLKQLETATNNFDIVNKLGQGGFGPVYKGTLEDGQEIAVKRLSRSSGQGMEEFINEVELISKLQHRNLVRLLGCCIEGEEILVYEYMPNKSLDAYIFDPLQQKSFDWEKRFNIIEGIARGLLYLHRDSRLRIIHRDLKASNILLDKEMNPKISDFGMAKLFRGNEDQANTERIVGTYGYISPEYATEGLYSEKSDVFSFGVLLLEIISGRKNTSFYAGAASLTLLGFAWKLWVDGNIIPLIDPQIYDLSFHNDILRCIHIGLLCVQELAKDRPTMASIMSMLQSEMMDLPSPSRPAFIFRQAMSYAAEQALDNNELCSINIVTISNCKGR
ncbi:uncharacterized protein LOC114756270 [Neltuma alba]|uniref:uncharacterized protein LOC114756270 n=1 Tax=Neltuma alba TaxID=207710 RepID=UPI0010A30521|nr:uncharacterized protein LOC114756270 [Prosopis alba]